MTQVVPELAQPDRSTTQPVALNEFELPEDELPADKRATSVTQEANQDPQAAEGVQPRPASGSSLPVQPLKLSRRAYSTITASVILLLLGALALLWPSQREREGPAVAPTSYVAQQEIATTTPRCRLLNATPFRWAPSQSLVDGAALEVGRTCRVTGRASAYPELVQLDVGTTANPVYVWVLRTQIVVPDVAVEQLPDLLPPPPPTPPAPVAQQGADVPPAARPIDAASDQRPSVSQAPALVVPPAPALPAAAPPAPPVPPAEPAAPAAEPAAPPPPPPPPDTPMTQPVQPGESRVRADY